MRLVGAACLLAFFAGLVGGARAPVSAECDGPYPPFEEAVTTAPRVIYGDVVEARPVEWGIGDGLTSRFTLRGWSLRGHVQPALVDIDDVSSTSCSGYLVARFGDRVAIAFDGRAFGTEVNAMAWVAGQPPDREGLERITERDLLDLVGIAGALPAVADADNDARLLPVLLAAGAGVAVMVIALAGAVIVRAGRATSD